MKNKYDEKYLNDNFVIAKKPDFDKISADLDRAKGPRRTMRELAHACEVDPGKFSRMKHGRIGKPLDNELILKIVDNADEDVNRDELLMDLIHHNGMVDIHSKDEINAVLWEQRKRDRQKAIVEDLKRIIAMDLLTKGHTMKYVDQIDDPSVPPLISGGQENEMVFQISKRTPEYYDFHIFATELEGSAEWNPVDDTDFKRDYKKAADNLLKETAMIILTSCLMPEHAGKVRTIIALNDEER